MFVQVRANESVRVVGGVEDVGSFKAPLIANGAVADGRGYKCHVGAGLHELICGRHRETDRGQNGQRRIRTHNGSGWAEGKKTIRTGLAELNVVQGEREVRLAGN